MIAAILTAFVCGSGRTVAGAAAPSNACRFDGSVTRQVLESYLARSITMEGLLNGRGDLEMPGSRTAVSPDTRWYFANDPSTTVPDGLGDEAAILAIWRAPDSGNQGRAVDGASSAGVDTRNPVSANHVQRRLYVAEPGIRNYLEYGGHGILVYDIDQGYRLLRRIPGAGLDALGEPMNVKGIAACAATQRLYVTTLAKVACYDLATDSLLWERSYAGGCDRLSITPGGDVLVVPSLEKSHWNFLRGSDGEVLGRLDGFKSAHNTVLGLDGRLAYLDDRSSKMLAVVDVARREVVRQVGPFGSYVRPFTVNGGQTRVYACVDDLLGFEVADLNSGRLLHRVEVPGFRKGPVKRHGCPSHGIGLTPDETQVWICDGFNQRVHIFDNTVEPPRLLGSVALRDQPGWVTFRLDGQDAWMSTGEVINVANRHIIAAMEDEHGAPVLSEKMVEIQFDSGRVVRCGDQFGVGRVHGTAH